MATTRKRQAAPAPELPHDMAVEIAGRVAASSPRPLRDIANLRASSRAMHAACGDRAVKRLVALEREAAALRWSGSDVYHAVVARLAEAGNPEACFLAGLALVFAEARPHGARCLARAAAAGHKAAEYVLGLLLLPLGAGDAAARYIRQVEGEVNENATAGSTCVAKKQRTNRECERSRARAVQAIREVTWNVTTLRGIPAPVVLLPSNEEDHRCTAAGCGVPQGWSSCLAFCSEECRIRHEYARFFSSVPLCSIKDG